MTKYLFCLPRFHTNAAPWVRILQGAGHQVKIHAVERGATEDHSAVQPEVFNPSRISRWMMRNFDRGGNSLYSAPSFTTYWRAMSSFAPDVVIVRGFTRQFSRLAVVCALLQGRRLVIYDQEDAIVPRYSGTWIRRNLFRLIGVPHVTTRLPKPGITSACTANALPFGAPIPTTAATEPPPPEHWPPRILMVAKYRNRKNHRRLIEALELLSSRCAFEMTFCGEEASAADERFRISLQEFAAARGLERRVRFLKNIDHGKMADIYREHDVFVLPSISEPAAVSPIEAAWLGCAVALSADSGTRGYFPEGQEYEFDPASPQDMARALQVLVESPGALRRARRECFASVSRKASDDRILECFEGLQRPKARARTSRLSK